jgi:hypothetical protein
MVDKMASRENEKIECGTFNSWEEAFEKIQKLLISDKPEFISPVSEQEFASGKWFASPINTAPLEILKAMVSSIYPTDNIRLILDELNVQGRPKKQIIAVYSQKS